MRHHAGVLVGSIVTLALPLFSACSPRAKESVEPADAESSYAVDVAPLFTDYCQSCHGGAAPAGGLTLEGFENESVARRDPETIERILDRVELREMPPPTAAQPPAELLTSLATWTAALREQVDCAGTTVPGFTALQRHSNRELANKLRDALALPQSYDFEGALGSDDSLEGFTNTGETLTVDAEYVTRYLDVVGEGLDYAFRDPETTSYRTLVDCQSTEETTCAEDSVTRFLSRALGRPSLDEGVAALEAFSRERERGTFDEALKAAFGAALVSPRFLMRVELDGSASEPHDLSPRELAARLSYFLWSAPPDEALLTAADQGLLGSNAGLAQQVKRMLRSQKREALIEGFASEWLGLSSLDQLDWIDATLRVSMLAETKSFLREVLFDDEKPVRTLLHADFTYVDPTLATLYDMPSPGAALTRVATAGTPRISGLLTQASLLAATSTSGVASPVKRGVFVLSRLLCAAPPPPPPGAAAAGPVDADASVRERLEQHRIDPACASCHASIDAIGVGLSHFDALGAYAPLENDDERRPIDASGQLPSGEKFIDAGELGAALSTNPGFVRCLAEKLLSYALGRRLVAGDRCVPRYIAELGPDASFVSLLTELVQSRVFRMRTPEAEAP